MMFCSPSFPTCRMAAIPSSGLFDGLGLGGEMKLMPVPTTGCGDGDALLNEVKISFYPDFSYELLIIAIILFFILNSIFIVTWFVCQHANPAFFLAAIPPRS